jgi:phospholipid transport system transporter-binding protein
MLTVPIQLTHAKAQACLADWLSRVPVGRGAVVTLNAANLQHFDSSALAVLLALRREILARGQQLVLEQVPFRLSELAVLYGVDELLGLSEPHQ